MSNHRGSKSGVGVALAAVALFAGGEAAAYTCDQSCEDQSKTEYDCVLVEDWTFVHTTCIGINWPMVALCQSWKVKACYNLGAEPAAEVARWLFPHVSSIMEARSKGSRSLTTCEKYALEPFYGSLVNRVQLHWHVSAFNDWASLNFDGHHFTLGAGDNAGQAYGTDIYLEKDREFYDDDDKARIELLAHEMVHSEQFERLDSSLGEFGYQYHKAWARGGYSDEGNSFEQEADAKVERIIDQVLTRYRTCAGIPVRLCNAHGQRVFAAISYTQRGNRQVSTGWFTLEEGECREVMRVPFVGEVYIYGMREDRKWEWIPDDLRTESFCTHKWNPFNYTSRDCTNRTAPNAYWQEYGLVDPDERDQIIWYTFN